MKLQVKKPIYANTQGANVEKAENANQGLDALVNPHKITVHGTVINSRFQAVHNG